VLAKSGTLAAAPVAIERHAKNTIARLYTLASTDAFSASWKIKVYLRFFPNPWIFTW
jgi:hypothetical protein